MFRTCIGCAGHLVFLSCCMKHTDYNLTLIKPLAGMGASKASGVSDEKERRRVDMKLLKRLGLVAVMVMTLAALGSSIVFAQETDDPVKIEIYKRFVDNRLQNPVVAYQAARDYLTKYNKDKDQYTDYLSKWAAAYERDERKRNLPIFINEKKFAEAYSTGAKILADEPNYLRAQIDLGYAGYIASSSKNEQFNTTALDYARTAIQAIESGKTPTEWAPFKGKDDTLAYLNYAVGYLTLKTSPDTAIDALIKA